VLHSVMVALLTSALRAAPGRLGAQSLLTRLEVAVMQRGPIRRLGDDPPPVYSETKDVIAADPWCSPWLLRDPLTLWGRPHGRGLSRPRYEARAS
jgi:hypothetical protein